MACFDKKLEASRENYKLNPEVKEVDTVITSSELIELLESNKFANMNNSSNQRILHNFNSFLKIILNASSYNMTVEQFKKNYMLPKEHIRLFFEVDDNFSSNGYAEFMLMNYLSDYMTDSKDKIKIERKKHQKFRF